MDPIIQSALTPVTVRDNTPQLTELQDTSKSNNQAASQKPVNEKLVKACQDFESVLVNYMLKTMRESVQKEGFLDSGNDSEFFQDMMDQEIANQASRKSTFGFWKTLYRQLSGDGTINHSILSSNHVEKSNNISQELTD